MVGDLTGWARPTSLVRWISMTSARSLRRVTEDVEGVSMSCVAFCKSLASGWLDRSSESIDISSTESFFSELWLAFEVRLRLLEARFAAVEGFAHSGTGCNRSNCRRNRLVYSFPSIKSSDSVNRNLRSRGLDAKETVIRSSSLSTHAALCESLSSLSGSCEVDEWMRSNLSCREGFGLESRKNS